MHIVLWYFLRDIPLAPLLQRQTSRRRSPVGLLTLQSYVYEVSYHTFKEGIHTSFEQYPITLHWLVRRELPLSRYEAIYVYPRTPLHTLIPCGHCIFRQYAHSCPRMKGLFPDILF